MKALLAVSLTAVLFVGCTATPPAAETPTPDAAQTPGQAPTTPEPTPTPRDASMSAAPVSPAPAASPEPADAVIEGKFDIGGHSLYLNCRGTGSPTIISLHGWVERTGMDPHTHSLGIQQRLKDEYRVCVYDRRNVAHSDAVDEVQDATDVMNDLRGLLAAADVEPPYVLLGGSFGGLLAYVYANTYPDDVVGMVLLDALFPDEAQLDHLLKPEDRMEAWAAADAASLERIVQLDVYEQAARFIGNEPAIPVIYLASLQEPWNINDYGVPEYDEKILDLQAAYVDRFSPGKLVWVDAPHFMEPAIPDQIAEALREVIELAR